MVGDSASYVPSRSTHLPSGILLELVNENI